MSAHFGGIDTVQSKFIWSIKDFEKAACGKMESPTFSASFYGREIRWCLVLQMNDQIINSEEYFDLSFWEVSEGTTLSTVSVECAILNIKNEEVHKCGSNHEYIDESPCFFRNFMKKDMLLKKKKLTLLNQGTLRIVCTITTAKYKHAEKRKNENQIRESLRLDESKQLLNLLGSGTLSDVVFSVEGREISAHKSIIGNRSSVFEAMFKHDMVETRNNYVVVEDLTYTAMYDLLKFIYSGRVPIYASAEKFENYKNLMIAANKYSISNLKKECERKLSKYLQIDNVFECLKLADIHDASNLKKKAIDFIACNGHEIIASPVYKEFGHLCPEIASEVFRAVVKKRKTE